MAKRDLVLTTIYFTRAQRGALRRRAAETGYSMSELIRRALDKFLAQPARKGGR